MFTMKNTKRRNDLDICYDILRVAQGGAKKTRIVYLANLNFKIVKGYLERLIGSELLRQEGRIYYATPEGVTYLTKFENLVLSFRETVASPFVTRVTESVYGG